MPRKSKTRGSQSKPSQPRSLTTILVKEDEWCTPGTMYCPDKKDWIDGLAIEIIQKNSSPRETSSRASSPTQMEDKAVICRTQPKSKDQNGHPLTSICELSLIEKSSQSFTSISNQSLITHCTTSVNRLNLSNTSCSCCETKASLDSKSLVLDRPKSIHSMLEQPATILGTLGVLPPEIEEMVFQNLSWDGAIHLAAANKYYRSTIIPDRHGDHKERANFLRSQESKSKYNSHKIGKSWFACTGCWCLKLEKRFNIAQISGLRFRKGGKSWRTRRCLACEIKMGRHQVSTCITNGANKGMVLCKSCRDFRSGLHCEQCGFCQSCMGDLKGMRCPRCHSVPWMPLERTWPVVL